MFLVGVLLKPRKCIRGFFAPQIVGLSCILKPAGSRAGRNSPLGVLKFLDRNGDLLIATESGVSYSKLPIWQTTGIQILCLALFILGLLLLIGKEVVAFRKQGSRIPLLCALIQLLAFSALAWLMYHGIANYTLVTLGRPLAICGVMIIGAGIIGIVHTIRKLSKGGSVNLILSFWNLASLLFPAWLVWMNIL